MRSLTPKTVLCGTTTGLLLCLWLGVTPDRAQATCGDYLHVRGQATSTHASSDVFLPHDDMADPFSIMLPLRDAPCSGPECSGTPSVPFSPPLVIPAPIRDPMLLPVTLAGAGDVNFLGYLYDLAVPQPIYCGTGVFHPPRCVLA